jgi:hypothetical protein
MSIFNRSNVKIYASKHIGHHLFKEIAEERFNLTVTATYYPRGYNVYLYDTLIYRVYTDTFSISSYTEYTWGNAHFCKETKMFINSLLKDIDRSIDQSLKDNEDNREREEKRAARRFYKLLKANRHIG